MKRACIYARVSTEDQATEGTSLDSQVRAMLDWAAKNDYEVSEEYILREEWSGAVLERPLLEKAKQWARDGNIDVLLVYDWDRLNRDTDHQIVLRWMFSDWWGVQIVCISEPQLEGFRLKLQRGMEAIFAEWEREKIRERTYRGMRERARQGKLIGGYFLYGAIYDENTGTRKKDPQTWPILFLIFRLVASGHSLRKVAKHLMSLAIPSPSGGSAWHGSTLSGIVRNRAYIGETYAFRDRRVKPITRRKALPELRHRKTRKERRPQDEWIALPEATPPLIPRELFDAADAQLMKRGPTHRSPKYSYLLSGRATCSCGSRLHGYSCRGNRYYRCPRTKDSLCDARLVKADELEKLVWDEVKRVLLNPQLILAHIEERGKEDSETVSKREHTGITQRLASLDMEERRLYRLYTSGRYDQKKLDDELDRVRTERSSLESRLEEIQNRLQGQREILERKRSIEEYCRKATENIDSFDFEQKRLAVDALDIQVVVEGNHLAVSGVIPTQSAVRTPNRAWLLTGPA